MFSCACTFCSLSSLSYKQQSWCGSPDQLVSSVQTYQQNSQSEASKYLLHSTNESSVYTHILPRRESWCWMKLLFWVVMEESPSPPLSPGHESLSPIYPWFLQHSDQSEDSILITNQSDTSFTWHVTNTHHSHHSGWSVAINLLTPSTQSMGWDCLQPIKGLDYQEVRSLPLMPSEDCGSRRCLSLQQILNWALGTLLPDNSKIW